MQGLLFYDAAAGIGEFYSTFGQGGLSFPLQHTGWRSSWKQIIPGNFGGNGSTDLLFYDAAAGEGVFFTTDGKGGMTELSLHTDWRNSWALIIPGLFGKIEVIGSNFTFDTNITAAQRNKLIERHQFAFAQIQACGSLETNEKEALTKTYLRNIHHGISTNPDVNASAPIGGSEILVNFGNLFPQGDNEIAQTLIA